MWSDVCGITAIRKHVNLVTESCQPMKREMTVGIFTHESLQITAAHWLLKTGQYRSSYQWFTQKLTVLHCFLLSIYSQMLWRCDRSGQRSQKEEPGTPSSVIQPGQSAKNGPESWSAQWRARPGLREAVRVADQSLWWRKCAGVRLQIEGRAGPGGRRRPLQVSIALITVGPVLHGYPFGTSTGFGLQLFHPHLLWADPSSVQRSGTCFTTTHNWFANGDQTLTLTCVYSDLCWRWLIRHEQEEFLIISAASPPFWWESGFTLMVYQSQLDFDSGCWRSCAPLYADVTLFFPPPLLPKLAQWIHGCNE